MTRLNSAVMTVVCVALLNVSAARTDSQTWQNGWDTERPERVLPELQAGVATGEQRTMRALGHVETLGVPQDSGESHRWRRLTADRGQVLVATAGPPPEAIREAQELLAKLGYTPGSANGMWHTRSIQAYRAFLRDQGRPDSSKLTPQALRVMRRLVERSAGGSVKERKRAQERELTPAQRQALDRYRQRQAQQQRQRNRQARERYRQAQQQAQGQELAPAQRQTLDRYRQRQAQQQRQRNRQARERYRQARQRTQLKFSDGSHYEGGVRDGKRNGQGTFIWANGSHYEGEWRNDRPHGQGILTMGDGRRYEGQWRNGCFGKIGGVWAVAHTTTAACGFE